MPPRSLLRSKSADFAKGLSFQLEEGSTADGTLHAFLKADGSEERCCEWRRSDAERQAYDGGGLDQPPGAWLQGGAYGPRSGSCATLGAAPASRHGDVNLSNTITSGDVTYLGNVSVGNTTLADPATNRDGALAGNVAEQRAATGRWWSPRSLPPWRRVLRAGVETGPGDISGADGSRPDRARGRRHRYRPVVGPRSPGRVAATTRVIIPQGI